MSLMDKGGNYYSALDAADKGDFTPLEKRQKAELAWRDETCRRSLQPPTNLLGNAIPYSGRKCPSRLLKKHDF